MARQTVEVRTVVESVNALLINPNVNHEARKVLCHLVETIMHETDTYAGFRWVDAHGITLPSAQAAVIDPDDEGHSRRSYYLHKSLRSSAG